MSESKHIHSIQAKILRAGEKETGLKKLSWPSLDTPGGAAGTTPIPLPAEPQVELQKQPDGTSKIIVTCTCGKRVEIICEV